jgi:hypothetical protein
MWQFSRKSLPRRAGGPDPYPPPNHIEGAPGPAHLGTGETTDLNWQEEARALQQNRSRQAPLLPAICPALRRANSAAFACNFPISCYIQCGNLDFLLHKLRPGIDRLPQTTGPGRIVFPGLSFEPSTANCTLSGAIAARNSLFMTTLPSNLFVFNGLRRRSRGYR